MIKNIGICFGGYCPMHQEHLDLIMKAKKENDICYVVVCGYTDEPRGNESDEDTQDEQGDEVDTENAIQEMTNAFGTQFKPKHIDSLQALADDYGIDLGEIVLDLTNLAEVKVPF
jgi:nicotinamide mononucleotide adenylyltransferase